uniref:CCHC-type domain-containing protein n=2 Tax=Fagus sylvatica TaxID=28930 RepID=A0A2N9EGN9_FAGSY
MTKENAKRISAHVGNLLKIDINENGTITVGKYLRMRVEIEAYAPLNCGFLMDQSPHPDAWFELKYERLFDFCFHCGRLGHLKTDCSFDPPSELALSYGSSSSQPQGPALRGQSGLSGQVSPHSNYVRRSFAFARSREILRVLRPRFHRRGHLVHRYYQKVSCLRYSY